MSEMVEIKVPHFAETLVEATVGRWFKQPGDYVLEYEIICELLTDKVNVEMPSPLEGTLMKIVVQEGETASVGATICHVQASGDQALGSETSEENAGDNVTVLKNVPTSNEDLSMRSRFSPSVLKLASEHHINLQLVKGTGIGGRIMRKDIEQYIANKSDHPAEERKKSEPPLRTTGLHLSEHPTIPVIEPETQKAVHMDEYYIDVTPIRNTIARNMKLSVSEIPHAWTMIEVDVTNIVALRNKLKDEFMRNEGVNLTYLAFLMKAVVNAIKDYPMMNSTWGIEKIIVKRDINISLAVGTEDRVVTPVIKRADQKNIAGLAKEIDILTRKARSGKLTLEELQGGTFTVNNTGSFGSILSQPIINYPQAAIITFESILKRPVVIQDMIAVRSMVNLCLSLDHRILDGVICGRFLQRVKENLESYNADSKLY